MSKMGVNTSTLIHINRERKKRGIKSVKCNCKRCLYYNRKTCKFGKDTKKVNKCIKFIRL